MTDGLEIIVAGLNDQAARKAAGTLGNKIEVTCPECGWHAWSYECYASTSVRDAEVWLLGQHDCGARETG